MNRFKFSLITIIATWILLVIGGIVNPMGASLACPDWYFIPTCNGELLPEMTGGVLYEHGHRLWASMVGILTLILAIWLSFSKDVDKTTKILSVVALFLVALQGTFGGVTVLLGLNAYLSTAHLVTAMVFFCLLVLIATRLRMQGAITKQAQKERPDTLRVARNWVASATVLALVQILLGGLIRHVGAGLACGDDWLSCGPMWWPDWYLGQIHMLHRLVGYTTLIVILLAVTKMRAAAKEAQMNTLYRLSLAPLHIAATQVFLGIATIATVRSIPLVVMHTGVGALLLASLFLVYLLSLPAYQLAQSRA